MRKRRTRSHIIADLSVNHVERQALLRGYTVARTVDDYGIDLTLTTYNAGGEVESGVVQFQLKATDSLHLSADGAAILFLVNHSDLELWLDLLFPLVLVIYDAQGDTAYWLYIQAYFERRPNFDLAGSNQTTMVRVPVSNVLNQEAMRLFARFRDDIYRQTRQVEHYDNQNSADGDA